MPVEVIGAGFGRTGTLSLHTALGQLGYRSYHMEVAFQGGLGPAGDLALWAAVGRGDLPKDTVPSKILAGYTACTDFPACTYYKELLDANPNAVVVLTVRDPEAWYRSAVETIFDAGRGTWILHRVWPLRTVLRYMEEGTMRPGFGDVHPRTDKAGAIKAFNAHIDEVKRTVPPARLLIFEVKEGWEPLCRFLGKKVPATPFPNVNDTNEFRRRNMAILAVDRAVTALLVAGVAYAAYTLARAYA